MHLFHERMVNMTVDTLKCIFSNLDTINLQLHSLQVIEKHSISDLTLTFLTKL